MLSDRLQQHSLPWCLAMCPSAQKTDLPSSLKIYHYFLCICSSSHHTHRGIISAFGVFNYCSQVEGLIKVSSCYLQQVWTLSAEQIIKKRLVIASTDRSHLHLEQIMPNNTYKLHSRFSRVWSCFGHSHY